MQNFSILNALLQSVFTGFGIVIPIVALLRTVNLKKLAVKEAFVLTAVQVLRLAGILYFILFCVDAYFQYTQPYSVGPGVTLESPLFGRYWVLEWFTPIMYLVLSQLFWIKKLRIKKAGLITLAILLLLLPSRSVLFALTNIGSSKSIQLLINNWLTILVEAALGCVVFTFAVIAVMSATGKVKKLAEQN